MVGRLLCRLGYHHHLGWLSAGVLGYMGTASMTVLDARDASRRGIGSMNDDAVYRWGI